MFYRCVLCDFMTVKGLGLGKKRNLKDIQTLGIIVKVDFQITLLSSII